MSDIAIKVENLSKVYRLGEIGTGTLSLDIERWWKMSILGQEDPFLKVGQANDRTKKGDTGIVYSLQDINFEIKQGEAVGIIGRNGAGKSTLLKILSRVTAPSSGRIHIKGRVASLLEVGTGFHPELTGRENIYLNGAILGMRRHEISAKLDEIIDFSGVERYIDTPVKRYSSGMYVRLAFAVAAHLESEILVIDEVLAVGDAEFQKKCLGKMGEVSGMEGRTVLFVSHNLASIQALCSSCLLINQGRLATFGSTPEVIKSYLHHSQPTMAQHIGGFLRISDVSINEKLKNFLFEATETIDLKFNLWVGVAVKVLDLYFIIKGESGDNILHFKKELANIASSEYIFHIKIPALCLKPSLYALELKIIGNLETGYPFRQLIQLEMLSIKGEVHPSLLRGILAPPVSVEISEKQ